MPASYFRSVLWGKVLLAGFCFTLAISCSRDNYAGEKHSPASLAELFGDTLLKADGSEVGLDAIDDKDLLAIYFSAEWCPPCRTFTPMLVEAVQTLEESDKSFEVVFVSSDRTPADMLNYMKSYDMPWLALPHGGAQAAALSQRYGVRGIPTLIVIDGNGNTISVNARSEIGMKGAAAYDDWMAIRDDSERQ